MHNNMKKEKYFKICITAIFLIILIIFCYVQNNLLTVTDITYETAEISKEFDEYTIVQLSDLHTKSFGKNGEKLLKKVETLHPDMIVLTGDLVDSRSKKHDSMIRLAADLTKLAPVYYVTGNHEYYILEERRTALIDGLTKAGVKCLSNETVTVTKGENSFVLAGLEFDCLFDMTLQKMELEEEKLNILLAHDPLFLKNYARGKADLVLAGHAHGGQFILPVIGPLYAPGQGFLPAYARGVHTEGDTTMIVSRGLGNSVIPVRLFNYPEIVCVKLQTK